MIGSLIISLTLTIIIEIIIALICKIKEKEDLKLIILINICTNPIVVATSNLSLLLNNNLLHSCIIGILEIFAFLFEGYLLSKYLKANIKPYILSLFMNITSFGMGVIIGVLRG